MRKRLKLAPCPKPASVEAPGFTCFYRPARGHALLADAGSGDAEAQLALGRLYLEGRADESHVSHEGKGGTNIVGSFTPGVPRNHAAAVQWLQAAADQGHVEAERLLDAVRVQVKDVH